MSPHHIILANNLTNDCVSNNPDFERLRAHVGRSEVARLFGKDEINKKGKLPSFLQLANTSRTAGQSLDLVFIRNLYDPKDPHQQAGLARHGNHNLIGTPGAEFVESIAEFVPRARTMDISTLLAPIPDLQKLFQSILGVDFLNMTAEERNKIRLLLVGVHTDKGILNLASLLRNQLYFPNVAVCPHLVGSNHLEAHRAALQGQLPDHLVKIIPGTKGAGEFMGLSPETVGEVFPEDHCKIAPPLSFNSLSRPQREILTSIFLEYEEVKIKHLGGGYSGSVLLVAEGQKRGAKTKPVIIKVDHDRQMKREVNGYHLAKAYLGNVIPTFGNVVSSGESTGVVMDFASMKGQPQTLQGIFEKSNNLSDLKPFFERLEHILGDLEKKLYANTQSKKQLSPYHVLELDAKEQVEWLNSNIKLIVSIFGLTEEEIRITDDLRIPNFISKFAELVGNKKQIETDVCLSHGDLNFANLISDDLGNVWAIDWTHTGEHPLEKDFAKMENDAKFIMIKEFEEEHLPRLNQLEAFLIDHIALPPLDELPEELNFVKDGFEFQKLYLAVRTIRQTYLRLKANEDPFMYRAALLRYSVHTLSFNRMLSKGECYEPQLKYALLSSGLLVDRLAADPFHKKA